MRGYNTPRSGAESPDKVLGDFESKILVGNPFISSGNSSPEHNLLCGRMKICRSESLRTTVGSHRVTETRGRPLPIYLYKRRNRRERWRVFQTKDHFPNAEILFIMRRRDCGRDVEKFITSCCDLLLEMMTFLFFVGKVEANASRNVCWLRHWTHRRSFITNKKKKKEERFEKSLVRKRWSVTETTWLPLSWSFITLTVTNLPVNGLQSFFFSSFFFMFLYYRHFFFPLLRVNLFIYILLLVVCLFAIRLLWLLLMSCWELSININPIWSSFSIWEFHFKINEERDDWITGTGSERKWFQQVLMVEYFVWDSAEEKSKFVRRRVGNAETRNQVSMERQRRHLRGLEK